MKNQRGQAVTESVLIIVLLFGFTFAVASYFRNEEVLKKLITGPFVSLAGMLQNGIWAPADKGAASHPTHHFRHIVNTGDKVR
jgi:hypothetical protein